MSVPFNPSHDLLIAQSLEERARGRHGLPRWYAVLSSGLFLFGAGMMTLGIVTGWFLPFFGAMALTLNVALFPALLVSWRARGVVPRAGRLASSRYWRVAPILVPASLALGFVALALWPEQRIWVWVAVVVPFTFEHIHRLRAWAQR